VTTIQGLATTAAVTRTMTIADIVAGELLENGTTGYLRTNCKPLTITTGYDETDQRTEVAQATYEAIIPPSVTWSLQSTVVLLNARSWANRAVASVDFAADTLTLTGTLPANGDRVIVTTSGTLPGGLSAGTTYEVSGATGATIQLKVPGGSVVNLTSAGAGSHVVRSVDGRIFQFRNEGAVQNVSAKLLFLLDYSAKGTVEVQ
jgi:hypothetical protein